MVIVSQLLLNRFSSQNYFIFSLAVFVKNSAYNKRKITMRGNRQGIGEGHLPVCHNFQNTYRNLRKYNANAFQFEVAESRTNY